MSDPRDGDGTDEVVEDLAEGVPTDPDVTAPSSMERDDDVPEVDDSPAER